MICKTDSTNNLTHYILYYFFVLYNFCSVTRRATFTKYLGARWNIWLHLATWSQNYFNPWKTCRFTHRCQVCETRHSLCQWSSQRRWKPKFGFTLLLECVAVHWNCWWKTSWMFSRAVFVYFLSILYYSICLSSDQLWLALMQMQLLTKISMHVILLSFHN